MNTYNTDIINIPDIYYTTDMRLMLCRLVDKWKKDNKVTALPLPVLTTCDIITILRDNADMLPPNRTAVENMKVGDYICDALTLS